MENNYCNNCWDEHTAGEFGCNCPCHTPEEIERREAQLGNTNNESWASELEKASFWIGGKSTPQSVVEYEWVRDFLRTELAAAEAKGRRDAESTERGNIVKYLQKTRGTISRIPKEERIKAVELIEQLGRDITALEHHKTSKSAAKLPDVKEGI